MKGWVMKWYQHKPYGIIWMQCSYPYWVPWHVFLPENCSSIWWRPLGSHDRGVSLDMCFFQLEAKKGTLEDGYFLVSTSLKNEIGPHEDLSFTVSTLLKNETCPHEDSSFHVSTSLTNEIGHLEDSSFYCVNLVKKWIKKWAYFFSHVKLIKKWNKSFPIQIESFIWSRKWTFIPYTY